MAEKIERLNSAIPSQVAPDVHNSHNDTNTAVLKKINMKVNYDIFETITSKKADKDYVDSIIDIALET